MLKKIALGVGALLIVALVGAGDLYLGPFAEKSECGGAVRSGGQL